MTAIRKKCELLFNQGFAQKKLNEFVDRVKESTAGVGCEVTDRIVVSDDTLRTAGMNSRNLSVYLSLPKDHPAGPKNAVVKIKMVYMDDAFGLFMDMHVNLYSSDIETTELSGRQADFFLIRSAEEKRIHWYTTDHSENRRNIPVYKMNDVLTEKEIDDRFDDFLNVIVERMTSGSVTSRDVTITVYVDDSDSAQ